MKKTLLAFAAATALATIASVATPTKAEAQVFVYEGARYCFYFDGWHGAGWYRCGYRWRQGLGWGGAYGWHGWRHSGWERRGHHRHGGDVNVRIRSGERDGMTTRSRTTTTIRSGDNQMRSGNNRQMRSGANVRSRGEMRTTTGQGRSGNMQGGGKVEMKAGPSGGANVGATTRSTKQTGGGEKNKP
jgi:hypothetical protein